MLEETEFWNSVQNETNPEIYNNSKIRLENFLAFCILIFDNLKIKKRGKDILLEFNREILPEENVLQNMKSYSKLTKIFNFKKINQHNVCGNYGVSLNRNEKCSYQDCIAFYNKAKNKIKESTEFNFRHDLKLF